jgi:DNA-binding NarL/FixJ family response regulator
VNRPRVLLADDHRLVAEGIKSLLTEAFEVVGLVEDGESLVEAARTHRPDLIVADISMPGLNGFEALARIRKENSDARIVVLTMHPELAYVRRALEAGALGYVLKHSAPAELTTAIRAALDGEIYVTPHLAQALDQPVQPGSCAAHNPAESLTPRQREILQLLVEGCSAKEIARRLAISSRTVEFHKQQMMEHLGLNSSPQLVRWAIKQCLVTI